MKASTPIPRLLDRVSPRERHEQTVSLVLLLQVFVFLHFGLRYHEGVEFVSTLAWWVHTAVVLALNIVVWNYRARRRMCWAWTPLQAFVVAMLGAGQSAAPAPGADALGTYDPSFLELCLSGGSRETFFVYAIAFGELVNPELLVGPLLVAATTGLLLVHQRNVRQGGYTFRQRQYLIFGVATLGLALVQYGRPALIEPWVLPHFRDPMLNSALRLTFMSGLAVLGAVCILAASATAVYRVRWLRKVKAGLVPGVTLRERRSGDPRTLPIFCRGWSSKQQLVLIALVGEREKRVGLVLGLP